jgi:2-oxoglutarate ferredoxin oxidoreductase subunit alpha
MGERLLMKGNEALAEAAIRAGCKYFFGYPITPQTEISHYMAKKLPKIGGTFIQAESEVSAINMIYGASSAGARCLTTSSSPGISLKQEGLSYMAGCELPGVVANMVRCGPGLGGILPSQCDYFQSVKGGGNGDYKMVVLAPKSVQELYELTVDAFNIADKYRIVSMIMGDAMLGQMMESVEFRETEKIEHYEKPWALTGTNLKREHNIITSINIDPDVLEEYNNKLQKNTGKLKKMK